MDDKGGFLRWGSTFFPGLELISRGRHVHHYHHHLHDPLEITWVLSGSADVTYCNHTWDVDGGDAFLIAPRELHAGGSRRDALFSFVSLHVPEKILPAIAACRGLDLATLPRVATRTSVRPLLDTLVRKLQEATSPGEQIRALADTLTGYLATDAGATLMPRPDVESHRAVRRIRLILDRAYETEVHVAELADAVHLHERYLISLFKTITGIPPHQYLIARRLEQARLMVGACLPLSAVAAATGFTDQSHLTRHFKRTFGVTPGAYQRDFTARPRHLRFVQATRPSVPMMTLSRQHSAWRVSEAG